MGNRVQRNVMARSALRDLVIVERDIKSLVVRIAQVASMTGSALLTSMLSQLQSLEARARQLRDAVHAGERAITHGR